MDRYKRINDHKMINKDDIRNLINKRLKDLNLKEGNVYFKSNKNLYFMYSSIEHNFYVSDNYKLLTLRPIITDKLVKVVKKKNDNNFLIDAYNLEILNSPYHEVRHAEQHFNLINSSEDYNVLINKSLSYMLYDLKFYDLNHPRFLSEHDCNINAMMLILKDIENSKLNVCDDAIYFYNTNIAYYLLRSRGFDMKNNELIRKSIFESPLHMLYLYNKILYNSEEINREELNNVNECIYKIRKNNKTEYDRIISGDNLSDETINELFLIANGKIKVKNIFKNFEEKELDKNNSDYIKKLLLK